jgi:outer membrane lipoprotein-sorting protein
MPPRTVPGVLRLVTAGSAHDGDNLQEVDTVSVFRSRPALRWLAPSAAAVLVIGGGAAAGTLVANAEPSLPARSAAQLLVDVQNARPGGLSGTVVQRVDLGLPAVLGLGGSGNGADITKLLTGSTQTRVWYAGENQTRLALISTLGETDVIRNGADLWVWRSKENTASHLKLPVHAQSTPPKALADGLPSTPQEAAATALAAIDPTTSVTTSGAAKVAGRAAYELVLAPRDTASLVHQVRLAIDAKEHIPLRVEVYAKGATDPSIRVAFDQISFAKPDAEQFTFKPPPGAKVTEGGEGIAAGVLGSDVAPKGETAKGDATKGNAPKGVAPKGAPSDRESGAEPTVVGKGWTSVLVAKFPTAAAAKDAAGAKGAEGAAGQFAGMLDKLPKVSGGWGSGRLLTSALFSALLTDDGRVLVGAVAPEKLYEAAGK